MRVADAIASADLARYFPLDGQSVEYAKSIGALFLASQQCCVRHGKREGFMKFIWLIGIAVIWMAGCAPADKMVAPAAPSTGNSAPRQAVEGFTGKTAVDAGERTKGKIQAIKAQRQENFGEITP